MSLSIGIPGGLAMGLCARFILSAFGSSYAALATGPLWLLIAGYVPGLFSTTYIAVARAQGRFNQASVFLTAFAALRMVALVVGGKMGGLYRLSYAMLAVQLVQSVVTTPSVLRTAFGSVTLRSTAEPVTTDEPRPRSAQLPEEMRLQQEAGLAALIALATRVAPSQTRPHTDTLDVDSPASSTALSPQPVVGGQRRQRRLSAVAATRRNKALTETNWWPDIDEATFRSRQEISMAALIAIATHAARF